MANLFDDRSVRLFSKSLHPALLQCRLDLPTVSFNELIEADHAHIAGLCRKLRSPNLSSHAVKPLLQQLVARLIRHDVSEELVMRPAFAHFWGAHGKVMAEKDRLEHHDVKTHLLEIFEAVEALQNLESSRHVINLKGLDDLCGKLDMHMKEESGTQLKDLEVATTRSEREQLGRAYAVTLLLTFDVTIPSDVAANEMSNAMRNRKRPFSDGLRQYTKASIDQFQRILEILMDDAVDVIDDGYVSHRIDRELEILGLQPRSKAIQARTASVQIGPKEKL